MRNKKNEKSISVGRQKLGARGKSAKIHGGSNKTDLGDTEG